MPRRTGASISWSVSVAGALGALLVSHAAWSAVALDSAPPAVGAINGGTLSWSHTISGSNRLLVVMAEIGNNYTISTVTYAGQALTFLSANSFGSDTRTEIWYLVAPPIGTNTVQVTGSTSTSIEAGSASFTGVDPPSPLCSLSGASNNADPATVTVLSAAGALVVGVLGMNSSAGVTSGSGQTGLWTTAANSRIAADTKPGAPNTTLTWTNASNSWALTAASITPAGASADAGVPAVATSGAAAVSSTTASLNGVANPFWGATTGWLRYSATNPGICDDAFGIRLPAAGGTALGSGCSAVAYTQAASGLSPGVTYYFCALASNSAGLQTGAVVSFTTPAPPTVETKPATAVSRTGATLNGVVNPYRAATTGWYRYSATSPGACDDVFGTRLPASGGVALGSGSRAVPLAQTVGGLSAGTTYFFCALASNSAGGGIGLVQSFSTPGSADAGSSDGGPTSDGGMGDGGGTADADGGGGPPRSFAVGCGCSPEQGAGQAALLCGLALVAVARGRRARGAPRPHASRSRSA